MSCPVNIEMPCDGDAYRHAEDGYAYNRNCGTCLYNERHEGTCLGSKGWPILAQAGADVALERGA